MTNAIRRHPTAPFAPKLSTMSAAIGLLFAYGEVAYALPTGEQVVAGQASVSRPTAATLNVTQGSQKAIVNWGTFSIQKNEAVSVQQPNASSVLLNRVVGSNPSQIYGRLTANGQVFLVNPNGVLFAPSASVDVGGLVASTLAISNEDFMAGRYRFIAGEGFGTVTNQGSIRASDGGTIGLLGGAVSNQGTIEAKLGTVALAAGNRITLDFAGDGLTTIRVDEAALRAAVTNSGAITADGGRVVLAARTANALTQTVVNQSGTVRARTLVQRGGEIILDGGDEGVTALTGALDASGLAAGMAGGTAQVLGRYVGVAGTVDARGDAGGGTVLIGGGFQGRDPSVRNAQATFVGKDASIRADAITRGNGGKAIVWGTDSARVHGTLSARGGAQGGNGGLVETSGKHLDVAGARVNVSAAKGKGGEWLLDPVNVTIVGGDAPEAEGVATFATDVVLGGGNSLVFSGTINNALNNGSNVTITTVAPDTVGNGDIRLQGACDCTYPAAAIAKSDGGASTLTLRADRHITMEPGASIVNTSPNAPLNVVFNSNATGGAGGEVRMTEARIATNGGNVTIGGGPDPAKGFAQGVWDGESNINRGIWIADSTIDVRTTGANNVLIGDGGAASVVIRGRADPNPDGPFGVGVLMTGSTLQAARGDIRALGVSDGANGIGVAANGKRNGVADIATTSGRTEIIGIANGREEGRAGGVLLDGMNIAASNGGSIDIAGRGGSTRLSGIGGIGVDIRQESAISTNGNGRIRIAGESTGAGDPGVVIGDSVRITGSGPSATLVIGATAPVGTDSIELARPENIDQGSGTVASARVRPLAISSNGVINLRPLRVLSDGSIVDNTQAGITIGGQAGATAEFHLSAQDLGALAAIGGAARAIVIGGNTHIGQIRVAAPTTFNADVTLVNSGGLPMPPAIVTAQAVGAEIARAPTGIAIDAALSAPGRTVALISSGSITQQAPISATRLLARSTERDVVLNDAGNKVDIVSHEAPQGSSAFTNSGALTMASVVAATIGGANDLPSTTRVDHGQYKTSYLTRTMAGDLTLNQNVTATNGSVAGTIDLVAANQFNNAGRGRLVTDPNGVWRVWSSTWEGQDRGGLFPNNPTPNIYGCTVASPCGIVALEKGSHFVYRDAPTLTVAINDQSRRVGQPNPPQSISADGVRSDLGDTMNDAVELVAASTSASGSSPAGRYPIAGEFRSPSGYRLQAMQGGGASPASFAGTQATGTLLVIGEAPFKPTPDVDPRGNESFVYASNLGGAAACFATGRFETAADGSQGADLLEREWMRVRLKPQVGHCLAVGQAEGCGDF
ncbi:MAG: filamentous hemagglutinin N-terminal domain-containing protein [Burkholderiales bacterium]